MKTRKLTHHQIATLLNEMSELLELTGANPFKARAYENAARAIDSMSDFEERLEKGTLIEVKGIGKNIAAHIEEIVTRETFAEYEELRKEVPHGVLEMLSIPGLGAKRARILSERLKITTIEELKKSCAAGRVATLPGFGEKSQQKIAQGIENLTRYEGKHLFAEGFEAAIPILEKLGQHQAVKRVELAGSLRRSKEIVKDIDLVASTSKPKEVSAFFATLDEVAQVISHGDTKVSVRLTSGINADLRIVSDKEFPFVLHHFTGSKEHNVAMRSRAKERGMKLNEYGLFKGKQETLVPCKTETDLFNAFGLEFIPPELREDMGEIEAAGEKNGLPKLVELSDLKGIIHAHSTYSDGRGTLQEMALATKALGFSYLGITDHSKSASYAGGLRVDDIERQHREIDRLNGKLKGVVILKGIECDILQDGSLDYSDDILDRFDFVIASIHSRFNMSEKEMTKRICKALKHPSVMILAHPTGRLLLSREPYPVDLAEVIACAGGEGRAIEINGNPKRLDLDWRLGKMMKERGVKTVITPDAHSPEQIGNIVYGTGIARKGWFEKKDVLNTLTVDQFLKWCRS